MKNLRLFAAALAVVTGCADDSGSACGDACEKTCCGNFCVDTDNDPKNCGKCGQICKNDKPECRGGICVESCTPKSCTEIDIECGTTDDGCGNMIDCGTCAAGFVCKSNLCTDPEAACTPKTCDEINIECGTADDGCGSMLDCGTCAAGFVCKSNLCTDPEAACTPKTCDEINIECGTADDGCGSMLDCGICEGKQICVRNVCSAPACIPTTCAAKGMNCGTADDGCGNTLNCGTCAQNQECSANVCIDAKPAVRDTYPTRRSIKGLQPDAQSFDNIVGNETHGVVFNMVWEAWQPSKTGECVYGQPKYDGYCYTIDPSVAAAIKNYSDAGVVVTAIVYGTPAWARRSCQSSSVVADYFCAPKDGMGKDYGRFVGFLANYFNGENGNGRIADFVIHNEVNAYNWFNPGCTNRDGCSLDHWTGVYAESYNAAYDYARKEQKQAKVLISFDHYFEHSVAKSRGVKDFMHSLIPKLGNREWMLAFHSYPPDLGNPAFGADDYNNNGIISFGNIGVLAGWLRANYPGDPHAWEIMLTENGINGRPSQYEQQRNQLCQAFHNVLGTPGITSFIYHRMIDFKVEGLNLGLFTADGQAKPAWEMFALANRNLGNGWPRCGFELLPYIEMQRGSRGRFSWVTTRQLPPGFHKVQAWKILREPAEGTRMLYECRVGGSAGSHAMISPDPGCEGQFGMGPLGYLYTTQVTGTVPVYRCRNDANGDHFVTSDGNCEGKVKESLVGYAYPM